MAKTPSAVRGMKDILPNDTPLWQHVESVIARILQNSGYQEIRMPLVEKTDLFARSIGAATDIVEKEMYTFKDRNGDSLSLRPEGTASCVRAGLENGLLYNQTRRLWYAGAMFRHERPQKGRYRQFHQIGIEAFGMAGPDIDAELILLTRRLWRELGLDNLRLEINSLGTTQSRAQYRTTLVEWLSARRNELDADCQRRLDTNPLRILDSKNPDMQALLADAPNMADSLDGESRRHFDDLLAILDHTGVDYVVNPRLVRGLDYYDKTVFEWTTTGLGAQGTVCAGGRYDGLVELFGGKPTPAIGCAMGLERLIELLADSPGAAATDQPQVYLIPASDAALTQGMALAESLRDALPQMRLIVHCGGGSLKNRFKKADKSGAAFAIVLGDDELARGEASVKSLRSGDPQASVALDALPAWLNARLD